MSCALKIRPRDGAVDRYNKQEPFPGSDGIKKTSQELREKRKQTAVKYLRKIL